jgi:ATP-dependent Clp protease ATP-binding subunit ClpX
MNQTEERCCSFCGKKESEVAKLVAGPGVNICDKCVAIANQVVNNTPDSNQPGKEKPTLNNL